MKIIYISLLVTIAFFVAFLPYIHINITSQSQGILRSKTDKTSLTSTVSGQVLYSTIKDNSEVKKGDTLIIIDYKELQTQKQSNFYDYNDLTQQTKDLEYLISGGESISRLKTSLYQKKLQQYKEEKDELTLIYGQLKTEYDRNKSLYADKVISQTEFFVFKNNLESASAKLAKLKSTQIANWQIEKKALQERKQDITAKNQQLRDQQRSYFMTAPADGSIVNFDGTQTGGFILAGQTIAQIAPNDSMIVECYVEPKDIGFITVDQNVKFQVHSFNYNQWGLASGKVIDIDKNLNIKENSKPYFRVRCSLDTPYLQLQNGYKGNLKKGITLTARFAIAERSLYELLFDKVDDWFNPKMNTPE